MMVSRSTFCRSCFPLSFTILAKLIEKNVTGDVFAVEQASIFYNICWFSLKSSANKATRLDMCSCYISSLLDCVGVYVCFYKSLFLKVILSSHGSSTLLWHATNDSIYFANVACLKKQLDAFKLLHIT